jgi:hypothetical protein
LKAFQRVATIFHIVEVKQAPGTQQNLIPQANKATHGDLPLGLHTQKHHDSIPVLFPNLKII